MTTRLPVEYPQSVLTLSAEPCKRPDDVGSPPVERLVYPTADQMRSRRKRGHGTVADRLARLYAVEPTGCWRWLGSHTTAGYGHFSIASVYYQAHCLMYILHAGAVPTETLDHLCRNRWCVNPSHLEPVSHRENIRRGIRVRLTPTTVEQIHRLRAKGLTQRAIGDLLNVHRSTVCRVLAGQRWPEYAPYRAESVA